jgi:hypothetical protein
MTKYYYTDPLQAAYMAKEFGVDFVHKFDGAPMGTRTIMEIGYSIPVEYIDKIYIDCYTRTTKMYVHPHSEHIFIPKEEDLIYDNDHDSFEVIEETQTIYDHFMKSHDDYKNEDEEVHTQDKTGLACHHHNGVSFYEPWTGRGAYTVMRANKHFFMPLTKEIKLI